MGCIAPACEDGRRVGLPNVATPSVGKMTRPKGAGAEKLEKLVLSSFSLQTVDVPMMEGKAGCRPPIHSDTAHSGSCSRSPRNQSAKSRTPRGARDARIGSRDIQGGSSRKVPLSCSLNQ